MERCPNCDEDEAERVKLIKTEPDGSIEVVAEGLWCECCETFTPD